MKKKAEFEAAVGIVRRLREAGYDAYFAGGCVRDLLLGREPSDYDVATSAEPPVVLDLFPRTFAVGAKFGVVLVCEDGSGMDASASAGSQGAQAEAGGTTEASAPPQVVVTEVATFRRDGVYSDGRHPDAVRYTTSAEEDVRRRDFTINGLLLDPLRGGGALDEIFAEETEGVENTEPCDPTLAAKTKTRRGWGTCGCGRDGDSVCEELLSDKEWLRGAVIDFVGGREDLERGVVRAIGQPEARFEEDRLRMLRAVRFAARLGFALDPATEAAIRAQAPRTAEVSRERVRDELTKMLTEGQARRAFELLRETGLLQEVLPEAARLAGVEQPKEFHPEGDVWAHVLLLLEQLEPGCSMTLGWAALLHDVGKPATFSRGADRVHFNGHAEMGVAIAGEICRRFRFSNEETRQIVELVGNHMRFMDVQRMRESTLKRLFRLERFEEHLALHRMDCMASNGNLENWEYARRRWQETPEAEVRPQPLVTGRELIEAGYKPGAGFRAMLEAVEEAQLEGTIRTAEEGLKLVRERFGGPGQ